MKSKVFLFIILLTLIVFSCRAVKTPFENVYINTYYIETIQDSTIISKTQKYELIFINDSICVFKHTFLCKNIAKEYRIIEQKCKYVRNGNMLIVNNLQPKYGSNLYIDIPPQKSKKCFFLTKKARERYFSCTVCPIPYYDLYCQIPNITNDTLYFQTEKQIIFEKIANKEPNEINIKDVVYCVFRKYNPK